MMPACPPVRYGKLSSLRVHPERLRPPEGDVRVEGESMSVDKPQAREPLCQSLEGDLRLELAQCGAQAVVDAFAKGERLRRVRPLEIERLRLREDRRVAPRCREPEEELRPLRQGDAAESDGPLRDAPPDRDGRIIPERLADGARYQFLVGNDGIPSRRIFEQPAYHVADEVGRRLVTGEGEGVEDRADFLVGQSVRILVVDRQ